MFHGKQIGAMQTHLVSAKAARPVAIRNPLGSTLGKRCKRKTDCHSQSADWLRNDALTGRLLGSGTLRCLRVAWWNIAERRRVPYGL